MKITVYKSEKDVNFYRMPCLQGENCFSSEWWIGYQGDHYLPLFVKVSAITADRSGL